MAGEEEKEEYELIPISPIRKLEKRIEELEAGRAAIDIKEFFTQIVDIIKMNQSLVEQLTRANDALRIEISRLPARLEDLIKKLDELIEYIKLAGTEEVRAPPTSPEGLRQLAEKMDQLIEGNKKIVETSQAIVGSLEELRRKLARPPAPLLPPRRIIPRPLEK